MLKFLLAYNPHNNIIYAKEYGVGFGHKVIASSIAGVSTVTRLVLSIKHNYLNIRTNNLNSFEYFNTIH